MSHRPPKNPSSCGLTRRNLFKTTATCAAVSSVFGQLERAVAAVAPKFVTSTKPMLENNVRVINTYHEIHCHGQCMLKAHVRDGRLIALTSAGDVPREESAGDESIGCMQRRACMKGYAERKRLYAPDRLKYPLLQTGERGNLATFKRISWDEAIDRACEKIELMKERQKTLGYLPIWELGGTPLPFMGPYLSAYGHHSAGNQNDCLYNALGKGVTGHPAIDMLNSKFIIVWSADPQTTSPHLPFIMTKAREQGIPIVVVDSRYTGTVGAMATGAPGLTPWIAPRPGTDSAILVAMMNTIYCRGLHNEAYLREYCFGFYPNDKVVSRSPGKNPVTGEAWKGQTFVVPKGQSFVEYLEELNREKGGEAGVLRWAAELSGVDAKTIETLALTYAHAKPACLYSGWTAGGAQRTGNGMYYTWLLLALAAMTGNATVRGGGIGSLSPVDGMSLKLGKAPGLGKGEKSKAILFSQHLSSQVILTGRDSRTAEQLRDDVLRMNGIDLGEDPRLRIEMVWRGAGSCDTFNQRGAINPKLLAWKKLESIICYERFMSSTARYADIVLPVVTHFEESFFTGSRVKTDTNVVRKIVEPMYESKPDWEINTMIAERLGLDYGRRGMSDEEVMAIQWKGAKVPEAYKAIDPNFKLPTFEEMLEKANLQLPTPPEKSVIAAAKFAPGEFPTDTGRINFYSPFLASRGRLMQKAARCQYVRPPEGREDVVEGRKGAKGVAYPLQFTTPHMPNRSHSSFDNTTILMDAFEHGVFMHPSDAQVRGISEGDMVYVWNDAGCMKLPAILTLRQVPGVVAIGEGAWYQPSEKEFFEAWFDTDGDGKPEKHTVPVDVGGAVNTLTTDRDIGAGDPFLHAQTNKSGGFAAGGNLCEVSKTLPR